MIPYPKWQYTSDKSMKAANGIERPGFVGRIIFSQDETDKLGGLWYDTPTELEEAEKFKSLENEKTSLQAEIDDVETIRAELDKKGIEYDKRWGVARLKGLIDG